jgi:hypothetical protein
MSDASIEGALAHIAAELRKRSRPFALVGGLAVSIRGEVPFTRDVDVAIAASADAEVEKLVRELAPAGYAIIARAEELLALKVLSMTERRPQDRMDAESLLAVNPDLDLGTVRDLLARITARGFNRGQDLNEKLERLTVAG